MKSSDNEIKGLWEIVSTCQGIEKAEALIQLSYNASHLGNYDETLAFCEVAKDIYECSGEFIEKSMLAHIYFVIGDSLRNLSRPAEAAQAFEKSVSILQGEGSEDYFHVLNLEGDAWYEAREFKKSYDTYRRGIEESNSYTCDLILARNYVDAGTALEKLKSWGEALDHFLEARNRYKNLKDPWTVAHCDEEISLCYYWLMDGVNSLYHAQMALDYAITADDDYHLMWAKARMALAKKCLREYEVAIALFAEAKLLMTRQANPPWKAIVKLERQVADILKKLNRQSESKEVLRRISSLEDIYLSESEKLEKID